MKKTMLILAATVAMGTAAIAQDTTTPAPATPDATAPTAPATGADATAPAATPQTTPDQSGTMTPPATPDQSATPPAADAGGMTPPPSTDATTASAQPTGDYPPCGKGVTDKCVQKGGKGMAHHAHKRMHKKK